MRQFQEERIMFNINFDNSELRSLSKISSTQSQSSSNSHISEDEWKVLWTDSSNKNFSTIPEQNNSINQLVNHFPCSDIYFQKDKLMKSIQLLLDHDFIPQTWILPLCHAELKQFCSTNERKTLFIVKPLSEVTNLIELFSY
jgi:hypothetical protein